MRSLITISLIYFIETTHILSDDITKSDLQVLATQIDGDIEFPDELDDGECFLSDKMTFTAYTCPYLNSFAVILPESTEDVSTIIEFITDFDTPFRIKSSGNSIGGYSKCEQCLNINLERMTNVEYKFGSEINKKLIDDDIYIILESGANSSKVVETFTSDLNEYNRRIPHNDAPAVTAGGYYQSGGWHETIRLHGFASDYVVGIEIVLDDGKILTIFDDLKKLNKNKNKKKDCKYKKDLLWAIRGSGGGSFGVITKYYIKTIPLESPETIMRVDIRYNLLDVDSGVAIMKACKQFSQDTDIGYKTGTIVCCAPVCRCG